MGVHGEGEMTKLKMLKDVYKPKESDIRKDIQRYLDIKGIFNWRQWQGQFSVRGVPDIIGILKNGRILAIEVKLPGWEGNSNSKHYQEQVAFLRKITIAGGLAFFARSVEEVEIGLE
jgi:Holliday junction resolvase